MVMVSPWGSYPITSVFVHRFHALNLFLLNSLPSQSFGTKIFFSLLPIFEQ